MANKHSRITALFFVLANFKFGDFTSEIVVQSNGNFTLRPNVQGLPEDILWRCDGNKVVEFVLNQVRDYGKFKGRTILDVTTGALTLTHLRESDSGEYVGELQIMGDLVYHPQMVKVFDPVNKPKVTCQENSTSVTLLCSGDNRPTTQYSWEGPDIAPQTGSQLKMEAAESSDSVYTCVLKNPVSENRTDFPLKSCFPEPESLNEGADSEGGNSPKHRPSGTVPFSPPVSPYAAPPKTGSEEDPIHTPKSSPSLPRQTVSTPQSQIPGDQRQGQDGGSDEGGESVNEGADFEGRGVKTEGGNSPKHRPSGTVPFSPPVSPSAAPPKTGSEDDPIHTPKSSPSFPCQTFSTPQSQIPGDQRQGQERQGQEREGQERQGQERQGQKREGQEREWQEREGQEREWQEREEQEREGQEREGQKREGQERQGQARQGQEREGKEIEGQDGGSQEGGAQPSETAGGGAENPTSDPVQELLSSPEDEEGPVMMQRENLMTLPTKQSMSSDQNQDSNEAFFDALENLPSETAGGGAENPTSDPAQKEEEDTQIQGCGSDEGAAQYSEAGERGEENAPKPDSNQEINTTSAEESLNLPIKPLSTSDPNQGYAGTTSCSSSHTEVNEQNCSDNTPISSRKEGSVPESHSRANLTRQHMSS
ncbi:hypothetical protein SKAU_G00427130 [Synaphobranchus kaupii]|uniref:Ig-like domain-containing protein n=1 Tax=Synaphobranchus kaupii TaxID=118154 RepID=A0A9Q1E4V3_SYNKA|nr:hypothetical protein SKAU_G00427130 [Synaphobranchus kaupii]